MEKQLEELKSYYLDFFKDCEIYISNIDLDIYKHYYPYFEFKRSGTQKSLSTRYLDNINWRRVFADNIEEIGKIESIIPCIEKTREIFELKQYINEEGIPLEGTALIEVNKVQDKVDLCFMYFHYKEHAHKYNNSVTNFFDIVFEMSISSKVFSKCVTQLIGFNSQLDTLQVEDMVIRKAYDYELSEIINDNSQYRGFSSNPEQIALGPLYSPINDYCCFMNMQHDRIVNSPITSMNIAIIASYDDTTIRDKIQKLILTFRLYNGDFIGCRTVFHKNLLINNTGTTDVWNEFELWNPGFSRYPNHSKEIIQEDVPKIDILFKQINDYYSNSVEQMDLAIDHFFKAFDQDYPVYVFTELIMSLESMFSEHKKPDEKEKEKLVLDIRDAKNGVEGLSKLNEYLNKNSRSITIKRLHNLLYPNKKNRQLYIFFNGNSKEKIGCYNLRNGLIHGNIALDDKMIYTQIEPLKDYVRRALLKLISLKIEQKLQCNSDNYFEEIDNICLIKK